MSLDFSIIGAVAVTGLNLMVPIALTAIGEIFGEKAGVVNIGLEGIILTGAWSAVYFSWLAQNAFAGILGGILTGCLFGALHGYVSIWLKGDQIISGVGINIFAIGFVPFAIQGVWGVQGQFSKCESCGVPEIATPWSPLSYFVPVTIGVALLFWFILNRTRFGSITKATGENPEAADVVGINVERVRFLAVLIGSILAGLSGAFLSIDYTGGITKDISAGRGFIALATVVFSGWNPLLGLAGGALFGFAQEGSSFATTFPEIGHIFPYGDYIFRTIPYVVTLIVVATAIGRSRFPKALGVPYRRE
jgi:general nucleoside transport system permease protein